MFVFGSYSWLISTSGFVEYNKQLFLDDSIVIKITEIEFSKTSFNIKYEIFNENDEKVINGSTLLVCFDYSTHRIKRVPNSFKEKCLEIIKEK